MIYVDNAATTAVHMSVLQAMEPYFTQLYGNPSAQHAAGHAAHEGMHKARNTVASCLGCTDREIIFTASGSEADNQALRTAVAWGKAHGRNHVVTVAIEHPAILRTLDALQKEEDIEVSRVTPTHEGVITPEAVAELLRPTTCLVSVMTLNNEVGTLQPVHLISEKAHKAGALFHTDAVQAMGHVPYTMDDYGADMLSLSAHKFHGPKGIGALICRESAFNQKLEPVSLVYGGGQERGHRAATENIPGMVGLATALKEATDCIQEYLAHVYKLRTHLMEGLLEIPGSHLMGDPNARVGILNICFEDVNRDRKSVV